MAVVSIKNKLKSGSLLVGNAAFIPTDFESIATVSVGSGGAANVEFTNIPSDYSHLQIRFIDRNDRAITGVSVSVRIQFNGDTTSGNYYAHRLQGDGSTAYATAYTGTTNGAIVYESVSNNNTSGIFSAGVIDILDYKSTNKNKTVRSLSGGDLNGSGVVSFFSSLWMNNTNAITSIKIIPPTYNFVQYSHFALYGIKG